MFSNKTYISILPVFLVVILPFLFLPLPENSSEKYQSRQKVKSSSDKVVNTNIKSRTTDECNGEYLYCGEGDGFKCIQVEGGIFDCCDQYPPTCPEPTEN